MILSKRLSVVLFLALVCSAAASVDAALVAQYKFDEGTGLTAGDSIGGMNAAVQNNPTPGWTSGVVGPGALRFDGSDWAQAAGNPLNGAATFTYTWWMKTAQGDKDAGIISSDDNGGARLMIWRNGQAVYANGFPGGLETTNFVNDDQWHHYALTKENNVAWQIYRDGILVDNSTGNTGFVQGNGLLRFARHANDDANARWPGALDDAAMWNEVVSAQQIALIHGLGRYAGVDAGSSAIGSVLAAFNAGPGNTATAGGHSWRYATASQLNNPPGTIGFTGGQAGMDTFIVLDAGGNGMILSDPTHFATIGAGPSIPHEVVDTANGPRTNVDEGFSRVLSPGHYAAVDFSFAWGQAGSVTPFLAKLVGDNQYQVLALGDTVTVTDTGETTVSFGGTAGFWLDDFTRVYAGFVNPPGSNNPVFVDNGTATLTDHHGGSIPITSVGQLVGGFSNPNLGRTYAFDVSIALVPEPSTLLLALPALGVIVLWGARRRRGHFRTEHFGV